MASSRFPLDPFDVFISYWRADVAWAERLASDLYQRGLQCYVDLDVDTGASWTSDADEALSRSQALVVLWSPATQGSKKTRAEIGAFQALMRQVPGRQLLPVLLGSSELLSQMPLAVTSKEVLVISHETYMAGADVESAEWVRLVGDIELAVKSLPHRRPGPATAQGRPG